jgi:HK97 family phage portal protein
MTKFSFWETAMYHLLTWGNFYAEIETNKMGDILNLWPLRPDRMEIKRASSPDILKYIYRPTDPADADGKMMIEFDSDEILHIPGLSFNGIKGYSPISLMRQAFEVGKSAENLAAKFYENDATPGGVLQHPGRLTQEGRENLKKSWNERHQGINKKFTFAVLEEGLTWKEIAIPFKDQQFVDNRKFQRTDICGIFRVPPHMIGDLERATFSNIEQQAIDFVVNTIRPWLVRLEQSILFKLFSERDQKRYFAEHLIDGLLRGDIKSRYDAYAVGKQWGWLNSDEIREFENMNPQPEGQGKIYLSPMNMMDAKQVGKESEEPEIVEEKPIEIESKTEEIKQIEQKSSENEIKIENNKTDNNSTGILVENTIVQDVAQKQEIVISLAEDNLSQRYKEIKPKLEIDLLKVSNGFKRIWEDGVARVIRRESIAIHRAIKRQDINGFESHLQGFYQELPEFISQTLHPSVISYCEVINSTAASNSISQYIDNHIRESRDEIAKWAGMYIFAATSDGTLRANEKAIEDCIDIWSEKRPEQAAEFFGTFFTT